MRDGDERPAPGAEHAAERRTDDQPLDSKAQNARIERQRNRCTESHEEGVAPKQVARENYIANLRRHASQHRKHASHGNEREEDIDTLKGPRAEGGGAVPAHIEEREQKRLVACEPNQGAQHLTPRRRKGARARRSLRCPLQSSHRILV